MNIVRVKILVAAMFVLIIAGCSGGDMQTGGAAFPSLKSVDAESWRALSQKKIFFGHKSVGANIMDGVVDVVKMNPEIRLNVVETREPADFGKPVFAHAAVGTNSNPKSKADDFAELMNNGLGEKVDIAFVKFCWLDFIEGTEVEKTLDMYKSTMVGLKQRFPRTTFIHVTVPLTSEEKGIRASLKRTKDLIKRIVGKTNVYENTRRNMYNDLLRKEYAGKEPLFDLAAIESTYPDGRRSFTVKEGKRQYSLVPEYCPDGGHLNEMGRRIVAEQLLIFLAQLK